jgi:hypothetical protein
MIVPRRASVLAAAVTTAVTATITFAPPPPAWAAGATPPAAAAPTAPATPAPLALSARVTSIELETRTVHVAGTATPLATILVDDRFEVDADGTGAWQAELTEQALGPGSVTLAEYVDDRLVDTDELDFFVGQPLAAEATFSPLRTERARVTGTATPRADIDIVNDADRVIGTTRAASSGSFETTVLAPDAGGVHRLTVRQSVDGDELDRLDVDLDYGAPVSITTPADGIEHLGGPVTLIGSGVPRGEVRVREKGSTSWLAPATTVLVSGTWRLTTAPLDDSGHDLEVVQVGRGDNRTTATITLGGVTPPVPALRPGTVSGPAEYTSGVPTRIEGTATPSATVTLTNAWGTEIAKGIPVNAQGLWHHDRILVAPSVYTLFVNQQLGAEKKSDGPFVIRPPEQRAVFQVVSPDRGAGYESGSVTTFTGTGDPRGQVHVENRWGTRITGPVEVTDASTWSLSYLLAGPSIYYLTFVETTPGWPPRTVDYGAFAPRP